MNLTPEQKAIGKQNFNAAMGSKLLRRDFLRKGIEQNIASGKGLGPYYFGYDKTIKEPLRVGVLGTGDEGSVLIGAVNPDFISVVAIADIRPYNVHRAFHGDYYSSTANKVRCGLMKKYDWKSEDEARKNVKVYGPYQDLIKDAKTLKLDAVIIALPLHLHAPAAIAAMRAGLHVLTEKLMGHSVAECKEMARVAEETKLHLATGHQRHYNILYNNAVEAIAKGVIGELHYIRAQWHRGNMPGKDSWQQPMPKDAKPGDALSEKLIGELASWEGKLKRLKDAKKPNPKEIQLWENKVAQKKMQIEDGVIAKNVAKYGYTEKQIKEDGKVVYERPPIEELIRWRLWNRTGGGLMAELGSHQLDASSIFISAMHGGKKQHPLNVAASSARLIFPPDRDTDDHVYCLFEYAAPGYDAKDPNNDRKKISVQYASINGNGFGGYGETVFGTNGTLLLEKEKDALLYKTSSVDDPAKVVVNKDKATNKKHPVTITTTENRKPIKPDEISAAIGTQAFGTDISRGYTEQIEHWAWCIRNPDPKNQPKCHPKVALADAVIALTTNIAARKGLRIEFNPEWFDPT
ncbi:MAG: Gfo/Idh/MocA family oxidoreductase, partial [Planctomycetota bacterium]|nr:Gfo/Idh/MocA family oxidoreductase [Planctomycetota bacterium]